MVISQRDNSPLLVRATEDKLRESSGWTPRMNVHVMHGYAAKVVRIRVEFTRLVESV